MKTIADDKILKSLVERLGQIRPDSSRRWGTLTAGEMLCHLGDANESVLGTRIPTRPIPFGAPRPLLKWFALYTAVPWPKGVKTRPDVDPRIDGTRPGDFEQDRERTIRTLKALAVATPPTFPASHFMFGPMSARDWHRWAYRHVTHHLTQFGL
jgi:hypothetical protein